VHDDHESIQTISPGPAGTRRPVRPSTVRTDRGPLASHARSLSETHGSRVSILAADRDLAAAVPAAYRPRAQRALWTASISFDAGPVDLTRASLPPTVFALLVLRGVLTRRTPLIDRSMIELLLAGDVVLPWPPSPSEPLTETRLLALEDLRLAVLDHRFMKAAAIWPTLMVTIQQRLNDQQHRLATHGAICQLPRVEQRVMAVMWLLASRTGTVTPHGTELPVKLTHDALAELTGSRRPTVSLAVKLLRERGHLARRHNGAWLLPQISSRLTFEDRIASLSDGATSSR
jgi:CRP/FNR family cyclic AMP-dependent transcriptional regulator